MVQHFFFFFSYQKVWVHGVRMVIRLEGIEDFFFFFNYYLQKNVIPMVTQGGNSTTGILPPNKKNLHEAAT